jgi:hypothetical protein
MRPSYLLTFVIAAASYGQDASLGTPALGFAFDESAQAIRMIRGLPGAALVEDPVDAGFPIRSAVVSPRRNFAIVTADDSSVRLLRFQNGGVAAEVLDGAMPAPERMLSSSGGHAALLYRAGRLQSVSGLPGRPVLRDWNPPSLSGPLTVMTISDDAELAVVAFGGEIWLLSSDGTAASLSLPASTSAVAFHDSRRELLALDSNGDVYWTRDVHANAQYRVFPAAGAPDGAAVRFSPDGARAYTAAVSGALAVIDLQTGDATQVSCGCRAESLDPMGLENVFRLTPVADTVLMLFDTSKLEPRVWFVPRGNGRFLPGGVR